MTPSLKFIYFDARARGEPVRMAFTFGGVKFEDHRITHEEWAKLKPDSPFGLLPILEVDGKQISQSKAITRYAAREAKLAGNNALEDLEIDAVVDALCDFEDKMYGAFGEKNEDARKAILEKLENEAMALLYKRLDLLAKENGGYLALKRLTWADLYFINELEMITSIFKKDLLTDYPNLQAVKRNILTVPSLELYIKNRPANTHHFLSFYDLKQDI